MNYKQKFSDALLLLKTERRFQIMVAFGLCAILFLVLNGPGVPRPPKDTRRAQREEAAKKTKAIGSEEAYKDIVAAFKEGQDKLAKAIEENTNSDKERDKKIETYNERTAEIFKKILERIADNEATQNLQTGSAINGAEGANPEPVDVNGDTGGDGANAVKSNDSLERFADSGSKEAPPPPVVEQAKIAFIGAGDSVAVKLIAAVNAPTDGTPYPVLFKLIGSIDGPDGSTLPLGEARLVAAAQGSLTDSRVLFRLTKLNLRLPDGHRKVIDVDGWVVGEDGIRGMSGVAIDPIGKGIAAAGFTGALGAVGEGLAKSTTTETRDSFSGNTTSIISGDLGTFAAGKGLSGFATEWSKIVSNRVKELIPHIEVLSGREGTAIFAQSVAIRGLFEQLEGEQDVFPAVD